MIRGLVICLISCSILTGACSRPSEKTHGRAAEPYISDADSVGFDIEPLPGGNGSSQWLATYTSHGKTAKFRIELGSPTASNAKEARDFDIETGEGRFVAEQGSDPSVLLVELKKALEAKVLPVKVQRVSSLPFTFASLGKNESQISGGGFTAQPAGNWMPMKIFVGEGEQEGEVFLNLNPVNRKGQFSMKDSDYGDIVLAQLASVL